ncbi:MAG TPA: hypothetical protein VI306_25695 [Pyrinomonadaceae bacterium]
MTVSINRNENGDPPGDYEFEEIEIAEEELVDAYVRNKLSVDERKVFERGLRASPQLLERVHFARLLVHAADRADEVDAAPVPERIRSAPSWWQVGLIWNQQPAFKVAFAVCVLVVLLGGTGLLTGWFELRRKSQQLAAQQAELERQKIERQAAAREHQSQIDEYQARLNAARQQHDADQEVIKKLEQAQNQNSIAPATTIAPLFLSGSSRASGPMKQLTLTPDIARVHVELAVDLIAYRQFLIEIKDQHEQVIYSSKVKAPRFGKIVSTSVLSKRLHPGVYSIKLSGISPDGTSELVENYGFRIISEKN